jgi:hypothetical protein
MTDLKSARQARRRNQSRKPKVVSALKAFRNGMKDIDLSQREHRACVARIEEALSPEYEAQELLSGFMKVRPLNAEGDLSRALGTLDDRLEFLNRRVQRQDAIRRVVCAAQADNGAALDCAERIVNGDHWLGMTWLPEAKAGRIRPRATAAVRTQSRVAASSGLAAVRQAARQSKGVRFTQRRERQHRACA